VDSVFRQKTILLNIIIVLASFFLWVSATPQASSYEINRVLLVGGIYVKFLMEFPAPFEEKDTQGKEALDDDKR
jgi:hypothetical protein